MHFKRTLALLMAMVMVFGMCPTTAFAATTEDGIWEYTVNDDGTATIDLYDGDDGADVKLVIPSELDGYPVTAIGTEAFYRCDFLSVTLPNTLTAIADDAFSKASVSAVYFDGTPEQWEALLPNIGTSNNEVILNGNLVILRYSELVLGETKGVDIYGFGNSVRYSFTAPEDGFYCLFTAADTDPEGFWAYFDSSIQGAKDSYNLRTEGTASENIPIGDYTLSFLEAGTEATVVVSNNGSYTQHAELTLTRVQPLGAGNSANFSLEPYCYGWYALRADQAADYTVTYTATDSYYYPEVGFPLNVGSYEYSNWHTGNGAKYDYLTMEEGTWLLVRLYNDYGFTLSGDLIFLPTLPVTGLRFGNDSHSGMVGQQFWPVLYTSPEGAWEDLTFTVEDESVAQVKNASGISCTVELVGAGETTLTVTSASGASDTMTVTAWMPEVLEAGVQSAVGSIATYESQYYSFTAPEDGTYYFRMPMTQSEDGGWYYPELSNHGEASDGDWNDINSNWDYENGWYYRYYTMEKDARVVFSLFNNGYSLDLTAAVMAALTDPVTEVIPDVTEILGVVGTSTGVSVSFAPYTAIGMMEWSIEGEAAAISEFGTNYVHIDLLASGEAVLTGTCGEAVLEVPITVVEPTALELGVSHSCEPAPGESEYFTLTSENGGDYYICVPIIRNADGEGHHLSVSLVRNEGSFSHTHNAYKSDGDYFYYTLEAGTTLTLQVTNNTGEYLPGSYVLCDTTPVLSSVTLDRELTGMAGEYLYTNITAEPTAAPVDLSFAIADESIARIVNKWSGSMSIELLSAGSTKLIITNSFGGTWEFPITVEALPELTLDEALPVSLEAGAYSLVTFTAPAEGLYRLFTPYVVIDGSNYSYDLGYYTYQGEGTDVLGEPMDGGRYTIFYLEEGTQLTVKVQNYHGIDLDSSVVMTVAPGMESFWLSNRSMTMLVGDTQQNYAWGSPSGAWSVISWSVADPAIAEIVESETDCRFVTLRAKAIGETTLTATIASGFTVTCPVSVVNPTTISLNDTHSFTVQMSKAAFFHFTAPADGVYAVKTPVLSTEDGEYACDLGWNTYTGENGGSLEEIGSQRTYSYSYRYYRLTEGTTVTLVASNPAPSALDTSITVENAQEATGIALVPGAIEGKANTSLGFRLMTLPEGAYAQGYAEYTVDDPSVAYLNWYNNYQGQIFLAKEGTATLTAKLGGFTATASITVTGDTKLVLDQTYTTSLSGMEQEPLLFTAPADSLYTFFVPMFYVPEMGGAYTCNIWDNGIADGIGSYDLLRNLSAHNGHYLIYRLTAGTTLRLALHNPYGFEMATSVTVSETQAPTNFYFENTHDYGAVGDLLHFSVGYEPVNAYGDIGFFLTSDTDVAVIEDQGSGWCDVRLLKAGTVTLTATCGGMALTQTVTVTEPLAVTVEQPVTLNMNGGTYQDILFTFPETGVYLLQTGSNDGNFHMSVNGLVSGEGYAYCGNKWLSYNREIKYIQANAGSVVNLTLNAHTTDTYQISAVKALEPTSLSFPSSGISGTVGENHHVEMIIAPENAFANVHFSIEDTSVAQISYGSGMDLTVALLGEGTTTLTATYGDLTAQLTITVKTPPALELDTETELTLHGDESTNVTFTAPADGIYAFFTPYVPSMYGGTTRFSNIYIHTCEGQYSDMGYRYAEEGYVRFVQLQEGKKLTLTVYNGWNNYPLTSTVLAAKAGAPTALKLSQSVIKGVPGASGYVSLNFAPVTAWADSVTWSIKDADFAAIRDSGSNYCSLDLLSVGETTLTATCGEVSAEVTIIVEPPLELKLDVPSAAVLENDAQLYYSFTAPEDGIYGFTTPEVSYYNPEWGNTVWSPCSINPQKMGEGAQFLDYFYSDNSCTIFVQMTEGSSALMVLRMMAIYEGTINTTITAFKATAPTGIDLPDSITMEPDEYHYLSATLLPEKAYGQIIWSLTGSGAEISYTEGDYCELYAYGEGVVTVTATCGSYSDSCTVTISTGRPLELDVTASAGLAPGGAVRYIFTAPESGIYYFSLPVMNDMQPDMQTVGSSGQIQELDANGDDTLWRSFFYMEKGASLTLDLSNGYSEYMHAMITVSKAAAPQSITLKSTAATVVGSMLGLGASFDSPTAYDRITWTVDEAYLDVVNNYGSYIAMEVLKAGTTTVTATTESGLSASCTVTITEPAKLELDQSITIDAVNPGDSLGYIFTAPQAGTYWFSTPITDPDGDMLFADIMPDCDVIGMSSYWGSVYYFCPLEEGQAVNITMHNYTDVTLVSGIACGKATEAASIHLEESYEMDMDDSLFIEAWFDSPSAFAEAEWTIEGDAVQIGDGMNNMLILEPLAIGTATVTVTAGELSATATVTVTEITDGECGDDMAWHFDGETGTLIIEGTGDMDDYTWYTGSPTGVNQPWSHLADRITAVEFIGDIRYIGVGAFYGMTAMKSVNLPESLVRLSFMNFAFSGLESVDLPDSLQELGSYSFEGCENLSQVSLPGTVTHLSYSLFRNCSSLKAIELPETLESIGNSVFADTGLESIDLPEGLVEIGGGAFQNANLTAIDLPEGLEYLGRSAFYGTDLTEVTIPAGITSIAYGAFQNCTSLASVTLPQSVTAISYSAFQNCQSLTAIDLPSGVTAIEDCAFMGAGLTAIDLTNVTRVSNRAFFGCGSLSDLKLPEGLTAIGYRAFAYTGALGEITIPDAVTRLESYAFESSGITKLTLNSVTHEVYATYMNCTDLTEVTVPEGVTAIDASGFQNCDSLTTLRLPESLEYVYPSAFYGCDALTTVYYAGTPEQWAAVEILGINNEALKNANILYGVSPIVPPGYGDQYESLSDALANADGYLALTGNVYEDLTVSKDSYLDLNGYTLTGNVTVEEGATLYVFDSATSDYTAENRGRIVGQITGDLARSFNTPKDAYGHNYKYLALEEAENVWSFHRYYLAVKSVILAPCMAGEDYTGTAVNYKTSFKCSPFLLSYVTAYGAKLTGDNTVYTDYLAAGLTLTGGVSNEYTTCLGGTMKTTNTHAKNAQNAALAPTANAYITLADGTELVSAAVTRSLQDMAAYANAKEDLTDAQKEGLGKMYDLFKAVVDTWSVDVGNIKAYAAQYCGTDTTPAFAIVIQPESVSAELGSTAVFSVAASGEIAKYRWYYRKSADGIWKYATGDGYDTDTMTVTVTSDMAGYQFCCQITDADGNKLLTDPATLTVN